MAWCSRAEEWVEDKGHVRSGGEASSRERELWCQEAPQKSDGHTYDDFLAETRAESGWVAHSGYMKTSLYKITL